MVGQRFLLVRIVDSATKICIHPEMFVISAASLTVNILS